MSSEVTICNTALGHLGDTAQVQSIRPPDSSVQAQYCSKFYSPARDALLEMYQWGFATQRAALALVNLPAIAGECRSWRYAYAAPNGMLNALAVLPKDAPDDYEAWFGPVERDHFPPYPQGYLPVPGAPLVVPQPYAIETSGDGSGIILTNVCDATLRYTATITDTTKFGPLFTLALTYLLASMLAGPILKGDAGIAAAEQMMTLFNAWESKAEASDANQRKTRVEPAVSWIRGR